MVSYNHYLMIMIHLRGGLRLHSLSTLFLLLRRVARSRIDLIPHLINKDKPTWIIPIISRVIPRKFSKNSKKNSIESRYVKIILVNIYGPSDRLVLVNGISLALVKVCFRVGVQAAWQKVKIKLNYA